MFEQTNVVYQVKTLQSVHEQFAMSEVVRSFTVGIKVG